MKWQQIKEYFYTDIFFKKYIPPFFSFSVFFYEEKKLFFFFLASLLNERGVSEKFRRRQNGKKMPSVVAHLRTGDKSDTIGYAGKRVKSYFCSIQKTTTRNTKPQRAKMRLVTTRGGAIKD